MSEGPTLRQLEYFIRTVDEGSFAAAATKEHMAQPSLSEQIRRLERRLGTTLFVRTNSRLRLTDVGRQLVPKAKAAIEAAAEVSRVAKVTTDLSGGEVSFGSFRSAQHYLLAPLILAFNERFPNVQVRVVGLNSSDVADAVRRGDLEAGLVELPVDPHGLQVSAPVLSDDVVYISAHRERTRRPVSLDQVVPSRLVLAEASWGTRDPMRRLLAERAQSEQIDLDPFIQVEYGDAALEIVSRGTFDTILPLVELQRHPLRDQLSWAHLSPAFPVDFAFISRSDAELSPATEAFIAMSKGPLEEFQGPW
ncbi:LysR family transcriptional regulator [Brevibacterium sediminis]|uniref:LysR family transcriptional regulator n=1 Tax=Brevibacterium sediminis TaxID=1857024 RepID=A0ABQ1LYP0_9MICO|nr:LysR family transcriptional regulator [Brevibacterium sediminis]GGC31404.1 LysR family transcriptional regulator [Brevibacterium sediminis]